MNAVRSIRGLLLTGIVFTAGLAMAANKGALELQHPTNVGGKQLAAGNYTVHWDGTGDQVEVKIMQGKKEAATTSARVVKVERPMRNNAAITTTNSDGSSTLSQIVFGGKDYALEIAGEGGAAGPAGAGR